jgi:hypothetical protein
MQGKHLFEYAVIRVVPRVERGEFVNVGIIVYCSSKKFLKTRFYLNVEKIEALSKEVGIEELEKRLAAFEKVCGGGDSGGKIGKLPVASRFRWLTATRSTIVQTSPVHPGFCEDPDETLTKLYDKLVK